MSCCDGEWIYPRGSVELLVAEVESKNGILLDTQPVDVSLNGTDWIAGTWLGAASTIRDVQVLIDFGLYYKGEYTVRVRVTDNPEVPIILVGTLEVR